MKSKPHIAVIGAGAFGGWIALHLLERGPRVTLLDAWGPGNSRGSSGGETRVMRGTYGPDQPYTEMAARALKLWAKYERRWKRQFLHCTGVLWMASGHDDAFESGSVEALRAAKIKFRELSSAQMRKRWPQINFEGIEWGIFEPECGYLDARASCQAVVDAFVEAGGKYRLATVPADVLESGALHSLPLSDGSHPKADYYVFPCGAWLGGAGGKSRLAPVPADVLESGPLHSLALSDGSHLKADYYVFACGPWLGKLFPQAVGDLVQATKQDIFFFGTPAGDDRFSDAHLPVWGDHRDHFFYGIPGSARRGFKIADDTRGPAFDPTNGERVVSPETLRDIREYVGFRFPALKDAPLVETRVCQYEQTPDSHFIIDRHPVAANAWIVGGGSGHGVQHGGGRGDVAGEMILKEREPEAIWRLERFKR